MSKRFACHLALAASALLLAAACSSDGGDDGASGSTTTASETPPSTTSTTEAATVLRILVTNDDGFDSEGIDTLVQALAALDDTEVTVVAPAGEQSGTGDSTSDGPVTATDGTTLSGYPATAVEGTPGDSVNYAFDELGLEFDLVISGVNSVQNIGPLSEISGTVGAAKTAARRGVPAIAASADTIEPPYDVAVDEVLIQVGARRGNLAGAGVGAGLPTVLSINAPFCEGGANPGPPVDVPTATDAGDRDAFGGSDCDSGVTDFADDIDAFLNGYVSVSEVSTAA